MPLAIRNLSVFSLQGAFGIAPLNQSMVSSTFAPHNRYFLLSKCTFSFNRLTKSVHNKSQLRHLSQSFQRKAMYSCNVLGLGLSYMHWSLANSVDHMGASYQCRFRSQAAFTSMYEVCLGHESRLIWGLFEYGEASIMKLMTDQC
jgi:hypothetical protein